MKYVIYVLLAMSILISCELIIIIIIGFIKERLGARINPIRIRMIKTGNKTFHLHTIDRVEGVTNFHELRGQIYIFRDVTQSFVSKIVDYQMTDYYVMEKRLQVDIDNFCKNLKQFGKVLQNADYDCEYDKGEDRVMIHETIESLMQHNRGILNYFFRLDQDLDKKIGMPS